MIRLALIGLGTSAAHQLRALELDTEYEVVAGCDTDPRRGDRLPAGSRFFGSASTMIREVRPDAVVVSVPTREHVAVATTALELECDVLVEKPAAMSEAELKRLYATPRGDALLHVSYHAAFARDLHWYTHEARNTFGPLRSFHCGFYDPYVIDGMLVDGATSLEGSWFDSGINALSVVAALVDVATLEVVGSTRVSLPQHVGTEIQAGAVFRFRESNGDLGVGTIDTNWAMGLNCKYTILCYDRESVLMDHSGQRVRIREAAGDWETVADFSSDGERLLQHYRGVFEDFKRAVQTRESNEALTWRLHDLLFAPRERVQQPEGC